MTFPVIEVSSASIERPEQLGSKEKFWFRGEDGDRFLFKKAREHTGEAFSEKVAAEIALLFQIPHAQVEFARHERIIGTASRNFVRAGQQSLIHGNELLSQVVKGYEKEKWQKNSEHTFDRIRRVFAEFHAGTLMVPRNWEPPFESMTPPKVLAGYLVFDALIGNVDRHHENWAVLENVRSESGERVFEVSPTFDHASSLGRELLADRKQRVLDSAGGMSKYLWDGRSPIYAREDDTRGLPPLGVVRLGIDGFREEFEPWLDLAQNTEEVQIRAVLEQVPEEAASRLERDFALALIMCAEDELARLR